MGSLSSFKGVSESQKGAELSENVAEDLIKYSRGNTVGNEQQFLLGALQSVTGWMYPQQRYTNLVYKGPAGGGKTHTQKALLDILPKRYLYGDGEVTDFSDNAPLDDPEWNRCLLAPLDEYDKISKAIREYMKSMAGEDGGYGKKRNVEDDEADGGYSPTTVQSDSMPFQFLYAPDGKGGLDTELKDRLLEQFVDSDKQIRYGIGRTAFGHEDISMGADGDTNYIYDTRDLKLGLRRRIRSIPTYVYVQPEGAANERGGFEDTMSFSEGEVTRRRGGCDVEIPQWVWYVVNPIFDYSSTHTNRVFFMLANLMRGSALWNHPNRPSTTVEHDGIDMDAYTMQPQDVANVLCCQTALLGTTHMLSAEKRDILDAVKKASGLSGDGATLSKIREWLEDNDRNVPSESVLRSRLKDDLAEEYYVEVLDGKGPNGADLFKMRSNTKMNAPRVTNLQDLANDDDVDLSDAPIDVDDPFDGVTDPIRDQPFKQTVKEFKEEFATDDDVSISAASAMGDELERVDDDGGTSLDDFEEDEGEERLSMPHDIPTKEIYYEAVDFLGEEGKPFNVNKYDHPIEEAHMLGIVDKEMPVEDASLSETVFSPTHDIWNNSHVDEGRVTTRNEAFRNVEDAWTNLIDMGLVEIDEQSGSMYVIRVNDLTDE